jgi:hypothetical protein
MLLAIYGVVAVATIGAIAVAIWAVVQNVGMFRKLSQDEATSDSLLASGTPGTARIRSADWTGAVINLEYVCRIGLTVEIAGHAPYDVQMELRVDPVRLGALQPGATVAVRVDPSNPLNVLIDFRQQILPPGAESSGPAPTAAALADAYRQNPGVTQSASAADLLATGQRVQGVLKSFADTGTTPRSLGKTPSRPEFLDDPMYIFDVALQFPNLAPVEGQAVQRVPRAQVHNLGIGMELACVVDPADPANRFVVDWGDIPSNSQDLIHKS